MVFMSLRELSRRLRVSPSTLNEWISGEAPMPDGAMFVLVAMLNEIAWREQTTDAGKVEWSLGNPTTSKGRKNQGTDSR
jgi:transcriptional regulator with XRE-family HTH domain